MSSVLLIGSTGSIGTQTLDILAHNKDKFQIIGLVANTNKKLLQKQQKKFPFAEIVLLREDTEKNLQKIETLIEKTDIIINAVSGIAGIEFTKMALKKQKKLLLANKESLVSCGKLVGKNIIPIDSELTGILQCLQNGKIEEVEKIILTCSGGPFHGKTKKELQKISLADALKHPTWKMGKKITIDSATLMNKGFELIAIQNLFGISEKKIEIVIHPQSLIHAMIQWRDGNISVVMSPPDMRFAIQYALFYPQHIENALSRVNFSKLHLDFQKPDENIFLTLGLARKAARIGGKAPARLNQINDEAVEKFLNGKIQFLEIFDHLQKSI